MCNKFTGIHLISSCVYIVHVNTPTRSYYTVSCSKKKQTYCINFVKGFKTVKIVVAFFLSVLCVVHLWGESIY